MITYLLAAATVTLTIPEPRKLDEDRLLDAIAQVENWDGKREGAAGEFGPWQMLPMVWKKTRLGKRKTMQQSTPSELRVGAREELRVRIATLEMNHHIATVFNVALAWGAGIRATLNGTASDIKRAYAQRVENIYESTKAKL